MLRNSCRHRCWINQPAPKEDALRADIHFVTNKTNGEPQGAYKVFTKWATLRWVLLMEVLALPGAVVLYLDKQAFIPVALFLLFPLMIAAFLVYSLVFGISKSNWGRFEKSTAPAGFWLSIATLTAFYLFFVGFPFYIWLSHR